MNKQQSCEQILNGNDKMANFHNAHLPKNVTPPLSFKAKVSPYNSIFTSWIQT